MNTYTWKIEQLDCIPSVNGQSNVVTTVHWRVNAISDQGIIVNLIDGATEFVPYFATIYGTQVLTFDAKNAFVNYADLTKDQVIRWVQEAMGVDVVTKLQESLDSQLETLANPPIINPKLPWSE
jgi:hypothetical protein